MIKKIKQLILPIIMMVAIVAPVGVTGSAGAVSLSSGLCQGASLQFGSGGNCSTDDPQTKFNTILQQAVNIFSVIVGIIAVIMIVVGGLRYITSGGDTGKVSGAKNTIIYAIVGLIIVAVAQFIVRFVLSKATGIAN